MTGTQDRKHYLNELINLYSNQLDQPIATVFGELIKEEKSKCIQESHQIKRVDMEAMLLAKRGIIKALSSQ